MMKQVKHKAANKVQYVNSLTRLINLQEVATTSQVPVQSNAIRFNNPAINYVV